MKNPKKSLTLEELRHMLRGREWWEFRRQLKGTPKKRGRRCLVIRGVGFIAYLEKGLAGPSMRVSAQGQTVVLKFIDKDTYAVLQNDWGNYKNHLNGRYGPVVGAE